MLDLMLFIDITALRYSSVNIINVCLWIFYGIGEFISLGVDDNMEVAIIDIFVFIVMLIIYFIVIRSLLL